MSTETCNTPVKSWSKMIAIFSDSTNEFATVYNNHSLIFWELEKVTKNMKIFSSNCYKKISNLNLPGKANFSKGKLALMAYLLANNRNLVETK